MAQNVDGLALSYLGFQVLKLEKGQNLNQNRDYHNSPDHPNHTMKFGNFQGGSLKMLREGVWYSYDKDNQWLSFDALKVVHTVTSGAQSSIGKLERFTTQGWDKLAKFGFPIYLYEPSFSSDEKVDKTCSPSHAWLSSLKLEKQRHRLHEHLLPLLVTIMMLKPSFGITSRYPVLQINQNTK